MKNLDLHRLFKNMWMQHVRVEKRCVGAVILIALEEESRVCDSLDLLGPHDMLSPIRCTF